ncbi:LLM class flavin-dependent oxidoreductase [Rhizobium calliandrae]|uniref:LLM class flavin-dependent oxidoreductase n=1 Tax=Rhizobium calliandrae TaxID=1312182 RepID=A0ABT7KG26_9HYPH|nr:LLM class flavin-dependent oxidoreductase [Rhizobium calliandrae]MDL2406938.1 LLM class flavin-dependent oxidoreductase [Rhizobium calliandrae]
MSSGYMILSAFFFNPQGDHRMSWRYPEAPTTEIFDLSFYQKLATAAEDARLDAIFIADHVAIWDILPSGLAHFANPRLEPITLLSALSAVTKNIGLISTISSSYWEPYNVARQVASLDHLSSGRASWNLVTSAMPEEAMNFGRDGNAEHATRYQRAHEFISIVKRLWDSWEDGSMLFDKASGDFADVEKVHSLKFEGEHFKVRGPLNVPRPPQGHPVVVQAGSSDDGKNFATQHADLHFAILKSKEEGAAYRADIDRRLAARGRAPESFKVLPGILPVVAKSRSEALERQAFLETYIPDRMQLDLLSSWSGVDLSGYSPDDQMPKLPDDATYNGGRTALDRVRKMAETGATIREIATTLANTGAVPTIAGTAIEVADQLEEWFVSGAADGFNLMFPLLPGDWLTFCREVVPELQRRGLFRTEYEAGTFRDRLRLKKPANLFDSSDK